MNDVQDPSNSTIPILQGGRPPGTPAPAAAARFPLHSRADMDAGENKVVSGGFDRG